MVEFTVDCPAGSACNENSGGGGLSILDDFNNFVGVGGGGYVGDTAYAPAGAGATAQPTGGGLKPLGFLTDLGEAFSSGVGVFEQGYADYLNLDRALQTNQATGTVTAVPANGGRGGGGGGNDLLLYAVLALGAAGLFMAFRK